MAKPFVFDNAPSAINKSKKLKIKSDFLQILKKKIMMSWTCKKHVKISGNIKILLLKETRVKGLSYCCWHLINVRKTVCCMISD